MCGGWFVKQLNRSTTQCHDGRPADSCYTPVLDWSSSNLSEARQAELIDAARTGATLGTVYAVVRGTLAPTNTTTPDPTMGRFIVTEAWVAEGEPQATGTFVRVKDNGLRCFVAPCANLTEQTLNSSQTTDIAAVDFAPAGLDEAETQECTAAMYGPYGLVVAGQRYTYVVNGTTAAGRTATGAYRRLSDTDTGQ
jgi:hypothetical protein